MSRVHKFRARLADGTVDFTFEIKPGEEIFLDPSRIVGIDEFTGLTDKNGKDVYEGDIVKGSTLYPMQIIWHRQGWHVRWIDVQGGGRHEFTEPLDQSLLDQLQSEDWEVIGNIYENPDLLSV